MNGVPTGKSPADSPGQPTFRCFVAVPVPREVQSVFASFTERVKRLLPGYRFGAPENLHITLQFLGQVPRSSVEAMKAALEAATKERPPFRVSFLEAGAFPDRGAPRILHIASTGGRTSLASLAGAVRENLRSLGYGDSKPFAAHITLGREKKSSGGARYGSAWPNRNTPDIRSLWKDSYRQFLEEEGMKPEWDVTEVLLMESILRPGGPPYTPLAASALDGTRVP